MTTAVSGNPQVIAVSPTTVDFAFGCSGRNRLVAFLWPFCQDRVLGHSEGAAIAFILGAENRLILPWPSVLHGSAWRFYIDRPESKGID